MDQLKNAVCALLALAALSRVAAMLSGGEEDSGLAFITGLCAAACICGVCRTLFMLAA